MKKSKMYLNHTKASQIVLMSLFFHSLRDNWGCHWDTFDSQTGDKKVIIQVVLLVPIFLQNSMIKKQSLSSMKTNEQSIKR